MKKTLLPLIFIVLLLISASLYFSNKAGDFEVANLAASMFAAEGDGTLYFVNWANNLISFKNGEVKRIDDNSPAFFPLYQDGRLFFFDRATGEYIALHSNGTKESSYKFEKPISCLFQIQNKLYAVYYPPFTYVRIDLENQEIKELANILLQPKYTAVSDNTIFWIEDKEIYRMKMNGGEPEKVTSGYANCLVVTNGTLYYNYNIESESADPVNQVMSFDLSTGTVKTALEPPNGKSIQLIGAIDGRLVYYVTSGYMSIDIYLYANGKSILIYEDLKYSPAKQDDYICITDHYLVIETIHVNPNAIDLTNKWHDSNHIRCHNYAISLEDGILYLLDVSTIIEGYD